MIASNGHFGKTVVMTQRHQKNRYHRRGRSHNRRLKQVVLGLLVVLILISVAAMIWLINSRALIAPN
ncbi:MAG TPA: hypothetical protein PKN95_10250 [Verrucomicrobiota bacterium]|nr:hypothetical protein [Verrucomicrobiota bacterium]